MPDFTLEFNSDYSSFKKAKEEFDMLDVYNRIDEKELREAETIITQKIVLKKEDVEGLTDEDFENLKIRLRDDLEKALKEEILKAFPIHVENESSISYSQFLESIQHYTKARPIPIWKDSSGEGGYIISSKYLGVVDHTDHASFSPDPWVKGGGWPWDFGVEPKKKYKRHKKRQRLLK